MIYYPVPLHLQPAYRQFGGWKGQFPVTERVADEILSIPMHSELSDDQASFIANSVLEGVEHCGNNQ